MASAARIGFEALVFEVMNTLIVPRGSEQEFLMKLYCGDRRVKIGVRRLMRIIKMAWCETPPLPDFTPNFVTIHRKILAAVRGLQVENVTEEEGAALQVQILQDPSLYRVPRETKSMLDYARKHFRIAVASNSPQQSLVPMMKHFNLLQYFDEVFTPDILGVQKPNPQFFHRVYEAMGVPEEAVCYIGSNFRNDVPAGWMSYLVFYDPQKMLPRPEDTGLTRVKTVRTMAGLRSWLKGPAREMVILPPTNPGPHCIS